VAVIRRQITQVGVAAIPIKQIASSPSVGLKITSSKNTSSTMISSMNKDANLAKTRLKSQIQITVVATVTRITIMSSWLLTITIIAHTAARVHHHQVTCNIREGQGTSRSKVIRSLSLKVSSLTIEGHLTLSLSKKLRKKSFVRLRFLIIDHYSNKEYFRSRRRR
jgi:hypothetical protein